MTGIDAVRNVVDIVVGLGFPSAIAWYVRDRRKNQQVKEATKNFENQRTLEFVQEAFSEERASLKRQISEQGREIDGLRRKIDEKERQIIKLEFRITELERRSTDEENSDQHS